MKLIAVLYVLLCAVWLSGCQCNSQILLNTPESDVPLGSGWHQALHPPAADSKYEVGEVLMVDERLPEGDRTATSLCNLLSVKAVAVHHIDLSKNVYPVIIPSQTRVSTLRHAIALGFGWKGLGVESSYEDTGSYQVTITLGDSREHAIQGAWPTAMSAWFAENPSVVQAGFTYYILLQNRDAKDIQVAYSENFVQDVRAAAGLDVLMTKAQLSTESANFDESTRTLSYHGSDPRTMYYYAYKFRVTAKMGNEYEVTPIAGFDLVLRNNG